MSVHARLCARLEMCVCVYVCVCMRHTYPATNASLTAPLFVPGLAMAANTSDSMRTSADLHWSQ